MTSHMREPQKRSKEAPVLKACNYSCLILDKDTKRITVEKTKSLTKDENKSRCPCVKMKSDQYLPPCK